MEPENLGDKMSHHARNFQHMDILVGISTTRTGPKKEYLREERELIKKRNRSGHCCGGFD